MHDRIEIKDLHLRTIIGINKDERRDLQDVLINLVLYADTRIPGLSDNVEDGLNYRSVVKGIIELVEGSRYYLVEKLCAEIANLCLEDPAVEGVKVAVEKPGALRFARSVGVTIERWRDGEEPVAQ